VPRTGGAGHSNASRHRCAHQRGQDGLVPPLLGSRRLLRAPRVSRPRGDGRGSLAALGGEESTWARRANRGCATLASGRFLPPRQRSDAGMCVGGRAWRQPRSDQPPTLPSLASYDVSFRLMMPGAPTTTALDYTRAPRGSVCSTYQWGADTAL